MRSQMKTVKKTLATESAVRSSRVAGQPGEEWQITRLWPHPKQVELIGTYTEDEITELATDISDNGLKHPVEVLPDGCLIAGHRRKAAFEQLGRETIPVIVRHDLVALGEEAVEMHLIRDNLMRSHYHPLKIARLYKRMKELAVGGGLSKSEEGDLRDQLAKQFNKSGRTLDPYVAVLRTPRAIQEAVERDELPMSTAEAIAHLSEDIQDDIVMAIVEGAPAKTAAARYLNPQPASQPAVSNRIAALARTLERSEAELRGQIDEIESGDADIAEHRLIFTGMRDLLSQLIERIDGVVSTPCQAASGDESGESIQP